MFERFTDRARHVVVLAQEEARALQHNYIGTEHLLLGLLRETGGIGARALGQFQMTLDDARDDVVEAVGRGKKQPKGHIPFTPRAKKTLELALRESLSLGHAYIGTEHLLLGLIRERDGLGAKTVAKHGRDLAQVRKAVLDLVPAGEHAGGRWLRSQAAGVLTDQSGSQELRATPAADASLDQAARLAGARPVGSHHLLLAAIADPNSAAAHALAGLGVDLNQAQQALREVDVTGTSDELPEEAGRRQMRLLVTDDRLTIETTDPALLGLARAALRALGSADDRTGTIPGDHPGSVGLANVWLAIRDSLNDIHRRASAAREADARSTADDPPAAGAAGE